jgi:predicted nucleotide-binding protein with TIR-like domain
MDEPSVLEDLKALFDNRDSLTTPEQGRDWLSKVAALVGKVDPGRAEDVRHHAQILALPLSSYTIGPAWQQVLQIVADVIAPLEADRQYSIQSLGIGSSRKGGERVFIGHGRSAEWIKLKEFLVERLKLDYDEFNRESPFGLSTKERLQHMLDSASFAFLVMTAEDQHADGSQHARENVIHEIGLFQGRHGFERAIVLLENGCTEFTNIQGIAQIRFPHGEILSRSEEVRRVLEREGLLNG